MFPWISFRKYFKRIWTRLARKHVSFTFHRLHQWWIPNPCSVRTHSYLHWHPWYPESPKHFSSSRFNFKLSTAQGNMDTCHLPMSEVATQCSHCWGEINTFKELILLTKFSCLLRMRWILSYTECLFPGAVKIPHRDLFRAGVSTGGIWIWMDKSRPACISLCHSQCCSCVLESWVKTLGISGWWWFRNPTHPRTSRVCVSDAIKIGQQNGLEIFQLVNNTEKYREITKMGL